MIDVISSAEGDWLRARAQATPRKAFLHIEAESYSFADIDRLVSRACAFIQTHADISAGEHAAVLLPNGLSCVLGLLALARLGMVIVPLSTRLTRGELRRQYVQADCRLLICERETEAQAITDNALCFPDVADLPYSAAIAGPAAMDANRDFLIIHTSGTSGQPKAALLTAKSIFHSALASAQRLGTQPEDRWLCVLPMYHVGGLSIILRSLIYGGAVEMTRAASFDAAAVNRMLSERAITLVSLAPTMLTRLLDAKTEAWNSRLRLILLGGEATSPQLISRCLEAGLPIAPSYGLSEAASQVATATPDVLREKTESVGRPLPGLRVRVVDEKGKDMPPGRAGEIIVKGPSVMRGYYKDRAATAKALRGGWLHTGDIGFLDEDGDLLTLQRREDLIISGGENIYPREVENCLREHPAIAEVVVIGLPDARWGQQVAAAIMLRPGQVTSADEIMAFGRGVLAAYKMPRHIRFVRDFPRGPSGKILRAQTRALFDK